MNFTEIAQTRQSCRSYDETRPVEQEKLNAILEVARIAPSACNGQPYHLTVCRGETAKNVAAATKGMGINGFADQAPVLLVISEVPYVKTAALGAKLKGIDYRSIDIGILAAYITAEATVQGLGSCILGWIDEDKIRKICGLDSKIHLVITLGYPGPKDSPRPKKRKELSELVTDLGND
ncbi:MAG: nitroreductase family protein [Oscillospiraceae bacterium]|nr:nitroreductase family protein [Oscillospiraceae bacterium]